MVNIQCFFHYCESSQLVELNVEPGCTVRQVRAILLESMEQKMHLTLPGLELDPDSVDMFPALSDDKRISQLPEETATFVIWPKTSSDGTHKPVLDSLVSYKKIAADATSRANAAELINDEMKPKLAKSGRPSPNPQVAKSSSKPVEVRFQALEQENRVLKQENHEMKEKIRRLKEEIRGLKQENHKMNSSF